MAFDIENYDPSLCPYCGGGDVESLGGDGEIEKRHCHGCGGYFVFWYDEPYDRTPIEVTDGHGRPL